MEGRADLRETLQIVLSCDAEMAALLLAEGRVRPVDRRGYLVRQGDRLGSTFVVLHGMVKIESSSAAGRSSQLARCGPGEWIGPYSQPATYPADIVALEATVLLAFGSGELPRLALRHPELGATLALSFARQLERITAKLDARSTLTAKGRICAELMRQAGDGLSIVPPPVIAELAHVAQTTRETASRAIAELERRGIVVRTAETLRISSPRLLSELIV